MSTTEERGLSEYRRMEESVTLDEQVFVTPDSTVTFIRLVFLAGA